MKVLAAWCAVVLVRWASGQQGGASPVALTIYNQDFAVARTTVRLDLKAGANEVTTTNVTSQLEPDSVVLRDPLGKMRFKVAEQNYDAGVVDQASLLTKFEGKTIEFSRGIQADGKPFTVSAKVIRAGNQPLVEVEGNLMFQLPGTPLFPAAEDGLLLKPQLKWEIDAAGPVHGTAELAYITRGMSWQATYNVVAPEAAVVNGPERVSLVGWVTLQNATGTDFPQATVKLMAGDVAKIRELQGRYMLRSEMSYGAVNVSNGAQASVTQQAFDDFHLYDLHRTVSLDAGETKQVQFLEVPDVTMDRVYQYDGGTFQPQNFYQGYHNDQQNFGTGSNTRVTVRAEIRNSEANHLGMPLPAGRIRLYRRDGEGQMEFVGEGTINHTPAEQVVKVPVGNAFDVTGERRQTNFHVEQGMRRAEESFEIVVKNQKATAVKVAVVEHLARAANWQITNQSTDYVKQDSSTIELPVTVPSKGEVKVTYTVEYTW